MTSDLSNGESGRVFVPMVWFGNLVMLGYVNLLPDDPLRISPCLCLLAVNACACGFVASQKVCKPYLYPLLSKVIRRLGNKPAKK